MPTEARHEFRTHGKESSVFSLLSGFAQQGAQTLFATQRILIDLVMRQNASVMHAIREQLTDPHHSPTAILGEFAGDGLINFFEGQKVLLELGKEQNELVAKGLKERVVGDCPRRMALVDLLRRSVDTFIEFQEEYLKSASKQTHGWVDAAKHGKPYQPEHLVEWAREGMDNFVKTQKKFLDVVAEETEKATNGKRNVTGKKAKPTEVQELAKQASESFMEAQKRLMDLAGKQINANLKTAGTTLEFLRPFPFLPVGELTREAVKSYVDAQKALMDAMVKPVVAKAAKGVRKPKAAAAVA